MDAISYEIKNIPDYVKEDTVTDRLVALVLLEQFTDERTMTVDVVQDLIKIALMSVHRKERRIRNMANLMVRQGLRYVQKGGMVSIRLPQEDFQLLELLKTSVEKLDASDPIPLQKFFNILSKVRNQQTHYLIKIFINSLIKNYNEHGNFKGAFNYKKK